MFRAMDKWLPGYLGSVLARPRQMEGTRHLIVCLCDHYEPFRGGVPASEARATVRDWVAAYPAMADGFRDADGFPPRYSFFYPHEEYDGAILDDLARFCRRGFGEVEIHLHHRHDTAAGLKEKLISFRDLLHTQHGLLGVGRTQDTGSGVQDTRCRGEDSGYKMQDPGTCIQPPASCIQHPASCILKPAPRPVRYGFIHGNWALCNARPDGDWCGVNEELGVLAETGCYADFTFPSAPSPTQPRLVNAIYYAKDRPGRPRGADHGRRVMTAEKGGGRPPASSLMLVTGPLALNWSRRKWGVMPRVENAEISGVNPPSADRLRLWARQQIHVGGRPDWVFVKLHTHGCVAANAKVLLGEAMRQAHGQWQREFNDGKRWQLHYVTARELFNLVKAAEAGAPGEPGQYRDDQIVWPV